MSYEHQQEEKKNEGSEREVDTVNGETFNNIVPNQHGTG